MKPPRQTGVGAIATMRIETTLSVDSGQMAFVPDYDFQPKKCDRPADSMFTAAAHRAGMAVFDVVPGTTYRFEVDRMSHQETGGLGSRIAAARLILGPKDKPDCLDVDDPESLWRVVGMVDVGGASRLWVADPCYVHTGRFREAGSLYDRACNATADEDAQDRLMDLSPLRVFLREYPLSVEESAEHAELLERATRQAGIYEIEPGKTAGCSSTGYGDGAYECVAELDENGHLTSATVYFIEPDDDGDEA